MRVTSGFWPCSRYEDVLPRSEPSLTNHCAGIGDGSRPDICPAAIDHAQWECPAGTHVLIAVTSSIVSADHSADVLQHCCEFYGLGLVIRESGQCHSHHHVLDRT